MHFFERRTSPNPRPAAPPQYGFLVCDAMEKSFHAHIKYSSNHYSGKLIQFTCLEGKTPFHEGWPQKAAACASATGSWCSGEHDDDERENRECIAAAALWKTSQKFNLAFQYRGKIERKSFPPSQPGPVGSLKSSWEGKFCGAG